MRSQNSYHQSEGRVTPVPLLICLLTILFSLSPVTLVAAADKDLAAAHPLKPEAAIELRGAMVKLSDFGTDEVAYLSLPTVPPLGGVIVLHEWWGLNVHMKQTTDRLAEEGFVALAVDLYNGAIVTNPERAAELMRELNPASAMKTITAATRFLRESPRFRTARVATIGWCMGGGISLQAALQVKGLNAAVIYYGPVETDEKKLSKLQIPILGLYALQDKWVTPEAVRGFEEMLTRMEKLHEFQSFEAVHAFANPSNASYHAEFAAQAWKRSITFLRRELGSAEPKKNIFQKVFD
jgi:carboxymethylenebutenolidase